MPSAKQCSAHVISSLPSSFSQRPLQQTLLFSHSMPSERHLRGSMQVPATQKREQQSLDAAHSTPCGKQLSPAAPDAPADASFPPESDPPPPVSCEWSSPTLRSDEQAAAQATHARTAAAN